MSVTVYLWDTSPLVFTNYRHIKATNRNPDSNVEFVMVDADFGLADDEALYEDGNSRLLARFHRGQHASDGPTRVFAETRSDGTVVERPVEILRVYDYADSARLMGWLRQNGCIDGMLLTPTPWEVVQ